MIPEFENHTPNLNPDDYELVTRVRSFLTLDAEWDRNYFKEEISMQANVPIHLVSRIIQRIKDEKTDTFFIRCWQNGYEKTLSADKMIKSLESEDKYVSRRYKSLIRDFEHINTLLRDDCGVQLSLTLNNKNIEPKNEQVRIY